MKGKRSQPMKYLITLLIPFSLFSFIDYETHFIKDRNQLSAYGERQDIVMIASTGRSGSTMLTDFLGNSLNALVLKTHLMPPFEQFQGKILFIFSNPDKATESIFHASLMDPKWALHFEHMESSDLKWLEELEALENQTLENNLLCYDALGISKHLNEWLYEKTTPTSPEKATILAIKYENLWDPETVEALKNFLSLETLILPKKKERGLKKEDLSQKELLFRETHNRGTYENPLYPAYDQARRLWEKAPPFQYLYSK
jgi:hypothetical protein